MPCTDSRDSEHPRALRFHHDRVENLIEYLFANSWTSSVADAVDTFQAAYREEQKLYADDIDNIDHGRPHRGQ